MKKCTQASKIPVPGQVNHEKTAMTVLKGNLSPVVSEWKFLRTKSKVLALMLNLVHGLENVRTLKTEMRMFGQIIVNPRTWNFQILLSLPRQQIQPFLPVPEGQIPLAYRTCNDHARNSFFVGDCWSLRPIPTLLLILDL